ncbi:hypothetical protein TNCV_4669151 [Trichonephila clavipes]|nr:hypothetical protein TNCV_4669151 [Trichonephila clavipes]
MEAYFSNGRLVIALQRTFHRHFVIPPRGHVPDQKCVLMWMDRNVPKKEKDLQGSLEPLKKEERVHVSN